jgi:glutamate dehydrogenase
VIGEGGNLGLTQRARVEVEHSGGRLFTDFIDNSAGVHASDREVNLKVLLGLATERGEIDQAERDEIVAAVVYDNFLQAQILSQEAAESSKRMDEYEDLMVGLEEERLLDRSLEELPGSERMAERARDGLGLTRPELAVLLAYSKRSLTDALLGSALPDTAHFDADLRDYFPPRVTERFGHLINDHPLRRELIATIVANQVLNSEGSTFVTRLQAETGSTPDDVVHAYRIARVVTGAALRWRAVEGLSGSVEPGIQRLLMQGVDDLVEGVARWYLVTGISSARQPPRRSSSPVSRTIWHAAMPTRPS